MLYVMLVLPMVYFAVFKYVPMANIVIAFKEYNFFKKGVSESPWVGAPSYQWNRVSDGTSVPIDGATRATYRLQAEDEGSAITVTVTRAGYSGSITSEPVEIGEPVSVSVRSERTATYGADNLTGAITVTGTAAVDKTLKVNISKLKSNLFKWFAKTFQDRQFYLALRNTLLLNILDLIMGFPAPIILAILLNELPFKYYKKLAQTVIYLPHFLSWIIIASMAVQLFAPGSGVINIMLGKMGIGPIDFLMDKGKWIGTYIGLGVWKEMGWGTIIYLAAITGINPELYEAAEVDGANRWGKIWHVTLPGIRSTIVVLLIMNLGRILGSEFDRPYALRNAPVQDVADVISTMVYRVGITAGQFELTAAIGLFQSVVCVIFLIAANAIAKRAGERGVW
jgi:putative aldouronate transport system permease protein